MRISRGIERTAPRGSRRSRRSAFTLLELLVGVAILSLLVVVLSVIFGGVSKTWQLGQSASERLQNIRAITDFITGELRSALLPVNRTDKFNLQFVVNPDTLSGEFRNGDAVFWQAPVAGDQTYGDVAALGYFVKWDESHPANPRPVLCRFAVSEASPGTNFLVYSQAGGAVRWLTDEIVRSVAPADKAHGYQGLIADNVVALFVQCLDAQGRPIEVDYSGAAFVHRGFDSRLGFQDGGGVQSPDFTGPTGSKIPLCVLPPIVRLSFVLIDARSAARLTPTHRDALVTLAAGITRQTPRGDAAAFVAAAAGNPQLGGISEGLREYRMEINLLNAR